MKIGGGIGKRISSMWERISTQRNSTQNQRLFFYLWRMLNLIYFRHLIKPLHYTKGVVDLFDAISETLSNYILILIY